MSKRVNVMLPESALAVLNRFTTKGTRSGFISEAVLHYVESAGRRNLRERLKAGYQMNAGDNLKIAMEWFPLEEEAWQKSRATSRRRK